MSKAFYKKVMLMYTRPFALVILTLFFSADVSGQQSRAEQINKSFSSFTQLNVQEKVYLHTDKEKYIAGELIWFKVYNVDASFHSPVDLSKVVYVELLNKDQKAIIQTKVPINKGAGNGSVYLPLSTATGIYSIRAYTNWMRNFGAEYYFEKPISIINTLKDYVAAGSAKQGYDVQLFPEGGNLVEGIQSKIAFRAIDQNGTGISFKGVVLNQRNEVVVEFQPARFGIGTFIFTPQRNDTYRVLIQPSDGKEFYQELPAVDKAGYVMSLQNPDENSFRLNVITNRGDDSLYVLVHTRQQVKISRAMPVQQGTASAPIDLNKLEDGISHITVFNQLRQPVSERLYFKRPDRKLLIQAKLNETQYSTREKVNLPILTANESGRGVAADMSISVFRADSVDADVVNDIESYLLLSSDLKGHIESPSYYLRNEGTGIDQALDNLMLTHGWRRFRWDEVLSGKKPSFKFLPEFEGHIIEGKVMDNVTGDAIREAGTYLSIPGKRVQFYVSKSDDQGKMRFFTKDFYGNSEMIIQTDQRIDSTARIEINSPFSESRSARRLPELKLNASSYDFLKSQSIGMQVQNIYASQKLRQEYVPALDTSSFFGSGYKKYLLDDYTRFTTMEEVLREYVPEVDVSIRKKSLYLRSLNMPYRAYFDTEPLILLDGVPIFSSEKLLKHDPLKIQKLEVVPNRYYLGPFTFSGIASFSTYKGNLEGLELDPRSAVIDYEGLQLHREFYSPVYESNNLDSRIPDFRNVLFWSGKLSSDQEGKEEISFYTSDQTGRYTVVIQGITADGRSGSTVFRFQVVDKTNARR